MSRETDLAYLAGAIDADGFISVQRSRRPKRNYYGARVGLTGVRRESHDLAIEIFGGTVTQQRSRDCLSWVWVRYGTHAADVLTELLPYLRIKREQALLALHVQEKLLLAEALWPATLGVALEELCEDAQALNVRGGRTPKAGGRELDGRTWDEMPAVSA